ncbi:MAG: RDD family protein, partial [Lysobacteraceae bacterium]
MTVRPAGARPAGAARRYAAWSLDFAVVATLSLLLAWPRVQAAAQALAAAFAALTTRLGQQLGDVLLQGGDPAQRAPVLLHDPGVLAAAAAMQSALLGLCTPPLLAYALLALAWHAGFQCGRWQASPGQHALGLAVTRADGTRAAPARLA